MKCIFFLGSFLLFSTSIFSQNRVIDSLESELKVHLKDDTLRVNILNSLAHHYRRHDILLAGERAIEANNLAKALQYQKGIAENVLIHSKIHISKSEFDEALKDALESLELYKNMNDATPKDFVAVYNTLGMVSNYRNDFDKGLEYFKKGMTIAQETNDKIILGNMLSNIGVTYYKKGDLEGAVNYYNRSVAVSEELGDSKSAYSTLNNIAIIYSIQGRYSEALENYNKILEGHKKEGTKSKIASTTHNMGILYTNMDDFKKAKAFFEESLEIYKELKDELNAALSLNSIGTIHIKLKEYEKGLEYLNDALLIHKKINNIEALVANHNAIGGAHIILKQPIEALNHFESSLKLSESVNDNRNIGISHNNLAEAHFMLKNYEKALSHGIKAKKIVDTLEMLPVQVTVNDILSKVYAVRGSYKNALESHQQFKILNDSLFNKENIEKLTQIEYEYKYKQALDSASIKELKLTKTIKDTSLNLKKSQRTYLVSIIIFLLISILLGGIIFYLKFRNIKAQTHSIIVEQKLLRSQMTPHFIFNSLSVLQGMILNKEEKKSVIYLSKFSKLLRIILENSRDKIVPLSQELEAVENYLALQNLENESYTYTVSIEDTIAIEAFEIPPMLIQPFVENAIEHAFTNQLENREIHIGLTYENKKLVCTIADNGIGIDAQPVPKPKRRDKNSLATTITSERLQILSKDFNMEGSVTIENRQKYNEQGTLVTLVIPHKKM